MQLYSIETQVMHEAVDLTVTIVGKQQRGERAECRIEVRFAAPRGTPRPKARIEYDGVGAHGIETGELLAARDHLQQWTQSLRVAGKLDEAFALGADRGAETGDDVGYITELLQDRVVGNGAHARYCAAVGGAAGVALPLNGARSGLEQDVRSEGAQHGAITRMREQVLLVGAQPADEVEAQICVLVEWILTVGRDPGTHDDGGQRACRQTAVGEKQVAVAALEARLVLDRHTVACKPPARLVGEDVVQARAHLAGVRAAAHRFAVRREDQRLDALEVRAVHRFGEAVMQPLDGERRRDLPDEDDGVGEARLQRQAPAAAHIADVGLLLQQALDDAGAGFEAQGRFEQRRYVRDVIDAKQGGKEDGDQHRRRRFRFSDEESDR